VGDRTGRAWVRSPEGEHLGTVPTHGDGRLCFGGDDLRPLSLMTSTTAHARRRRQAPAA